MSWKCVEEKCKKEEELSKRSPESWFEVTIIKKSKLVVIHIALASLSTIVVIRRLILIKA